MPVSEQAYACVALEDPDGQRELHRGRLREKPAMTVAHNRIGVRLGYQLLQARGRGDRRRGADDPRSNPYRRRGRRDGEMPRPLRPPDTARTAPQGVRPGVSAVRRRLRPDLSRGHGRRLLPPG